MVAVKKGDTVRVHYIGKLSSGTVFDDSRQRQPLLFTVGAHALIEGFENALLGMKTGDSKTVTIASKDAYGPHRKELLLSASLDKLPPNVHPAIGQQLQVTADDNQPIVVTVVEITEDRVILDANHPLAGQDLIFEIRLIEIVTS